MTFNELLSEAELLYESINSSNAPGFTAEEWGKFFTIGQRKVVLNILREGIEKSAFNQLAIEKLVQEDPYTSFSTDGVPITNVVITDIGDTFTKAGHGLVNGDKVMLSSIVTTTGIDTYTTYYVVNVAGNVFQLSLTSGGAVVTVAGGDGTCTVAKFSHFKNVDGSAAQRLNVGNKAFNTNFFWILDEYVTTSTYGNVPVRRITYDFYRRNLKNPFRKPDLEDEVWMIQFSLDDPTIATSTAPVFIVDAGTTVLTSYRVVGVNHPDNYPIVSGVVYPTGGTHASCLNPSVHPRIVEEAVTLARMSVTDQAGYQLAVTEFNK